jgi:hypothetical protein
MRNKTVSKSTPWHTICVTLDCGLIEELNDFAYENDFARSAIIEYALNVVFGQKDAKTKKRLADRINEAGYDRSTRRARYAAREGG